MYRKFPPQAWTASYKTVPWQSAAKFRIYDLTIITDSLTQPRSFLILLIGAAIVGLSYQRLSRVGCYSHSPPDCSQEHLKVGFKYKTGVLSSRGPSFNSAFVANPQSLASISTRHCLEEHPAIAATTAMRDDASNDTGAKPLMTAWNVESQIHLIVGANPLAAARCTKSLDAGAQPIIVAPDTADMHFTLAEHIANGSAKCIRRDFQDGDLTSLGREEVDRVVDTVFVTLGGGHPLSMSWSMALSVDLSDISLRRLTYFETMSTASNSGERV